jgi:hypothetical protein
MKIFLFGLTLSLSLFYSVKAANTVFTVNPATIKNGSVYTLNCSYRIDQTNGEAFNFLAISKAKLIFYNLTNPAILKKSKSFKALLKYFKFLYIFL